MIDYWQNLSITTINILQMEGLAWVVLPMRLASGLGEELFYIPVITFLFWCVDRRLGLRLLYFLLISAIINSLFKWSWHLPRPYWIADSIQAGYIETSFGAPSGHSQNALGLWLWLAYMWYQFKNDQRWFIPAALLALVISLSRVVLGVHFLHDVLSGWIIAIALLALFVLFTQKIANWTDAGNQMGPVWTLTIGSSVILFGLAYIVLNYMTILVQPSWQDLALKGHQNLGKNIAIAPYNAAPFMGYMALLIGTSISLPFTSKWSNFQEKTSLGKMIIRYIVGLGLFFVVYIGLAYLFPKQGESYYMVFRFLRYFLIGVFTVLFIPYVFIRTGLAQQK